jgi:hypothetical protein
MNRPLSDYLGIGGRQPNLREGAALVARAADIHTVPARSSARTPAREEWHTWVIRRGGDGSQAGGYVTLCPSVIYHRPHVRSSQRRVSGQTHRTSSGRRADPAMSRRARAPAAARRPTCTSSTYRHPVYGTCSRGRIFNTRAMMMRRRHCAGACPEIPQRGPLAASGRISWPVALFLLLLQELATGHCSNGGGCADDSLNSPPAERHTTAGRRGSRRASHLRR